MKREGTSEKGDGILRTEWRTLLWMAIVALATVLTFHEGMNYELLSDWDDVSFVVINPHITLSWKNFFFYLLHPFQDLFSPLPMWSLMVDRALWGVKPLGYHLHNLLLHILAAWTLMAMLRKMGIRLALAGLGALLWALNPQKVESVIWISERKDVLCGLFAFLSMWLFLEHRWGWCALCTVLAIFAKPAALVLPCFYVVWIWGRGEKLLRREVVVPTAVGLCAVIWSIVVTKQTNPGTVETSLMVPLHNLFWYPLTSLVPFETNPFYPEVITLDTRTFVVMVAGMTLLVVGIVLAWRLKCPWRGILAGLALIGGTMLPVLGLLRYTNFRYCDRYNYLVSAAVIGILCLLLELSFRRWMIPRLHHVLLVLLAVGVVGYASAAYLYVPYWANCVKLSYYGLQQPGRPNLQAYVMGIMAGFRMDAYEYLDYLRRELPQRPPLTHYDAETSVQTMLLFMDAHQHFQKGDYQTAEECYQRLIKTMAQGNVGNGQVKVALPPPLIAWIHEDLASIAEQQGDEVKAIFYREAMKSQ